MLDNMITAKALVDWLPAGRHYEFEFERPNILPFGAGTSHAANESWSTRNMGTLFDELYVNDKTVVLSSTSEIFNKFPNVVLHTSTSVICSFWASFFLPSVISPEEVSSCKTPDTSGRIQRGIVVLESERLTFMDDDGENYVARLPCRAAAAWPLDAGVLIERQPSADETINGNRAAVFQFSRNMFTIFSLSHPLDEAAPVLLKVPLPQGGFGICFVSDVNLRIVRVFCEQNLVLTRHCVTGMHSLWLIQKALPEDYIHLYEVDDVDGHARVAHWALNRFIPLPQINVNHNTPSFPAFVKDTSVDLPMNDNSLQMENLRVTDVRMNSPAENPTILHHHQHHQTKLCLSPFAASLSRLLYASKGTHQALMIDSPVAPPGSPVVMACPLTPSNLTAHIDRLSSVASTRLGFNGAAVSNRRATGCSSTKSTPSHHISRSVLLHSFAALNSTPTTLRPVASTSRVISTGVATGAPSNLLDSTYTEEFLDEPLLPKVCLRLIWTESNFSSIHSKSKPHLCWNVENRDSRSGLFPGYVTTSIVADDRPDFTREPTESLLSSRYLLANKRALDLSHPSTPVDMHSRSQCPLTSPSSGPSQTPLLPRKHRVLIGSSSHLVNDAAFLAVDMVLVRWICFLTAAKEPNASDHTTQLACIHAQSLLSGDHFSSKPGSSSLVTYLPAISAVYVPQSRLTACLDPNAGIMLYTGVLKVCVLGVSPPPIFGTYSAMGSPRFVHRYRRFCGSSNFRSPFIIRPSCTDLDQWNQNSIPTILDRVDAVVERIAGQCEDKTWQIEQPSPSFPFKKWDSCRIQSSISLLGAESTIDSSNCSTVLANDSCTLRDASGNAFTLSYLHKPPTVNAEQLLRVYLPLLTENELVKRCLNALQWNLPHEISLHLMSRWYTTVNAPGVSSVQQSCTDLTKSAEWYRFVHFLLQICGFQISDDDFPPQVANDSESVEVHSTVLGSLAHGAKRQCSTMDGASDLCWSRLSHVISYNRINSPSLFPVSPFTVEAAASSPHSPRLLPAIRSDPTARRLLSHLPAILLSLHLAYEEAKLNCLLAPQLHFMAQFNLLLSRILDLPSFINYYLCEIPDGFDGEYSTHLPDWNPPIRDIIALPDCFPTDAPPCLLTWLVERLETPLAFGSSIGVVNPYLHLPHVNDLAAGLAGMLLTSLYSEQSSQQGAFNADSSEFIQRSLKWWRANLLRLTNETEFPELRTALSDASVNPSDPLSLAFVESFLMAKRIGNCTPSEDEKFSSKEHTSSGFMAPHNLAIIFLSNLDKYLSADTQTSISSQLCSLPSGFATIVRLILSRSCANPPPNCAPHVYQLMGRNDLTRLNELTIADGLAPNQMDFNQVNKSESIHRQFDRLRKPFSMHGSRTSVSERWASEVGPLIDSGPQDSRSHRILGKRHSLLSHLESSPFVQASFKDDLRLREAYRLLQSSSHIRLPRLSSTDGTSGLSPSGESAVEQGSRLVEPRLEMHLAAAGIRVWASLIGRGMLGLSTLCGSRLSTKLPIPPICLRGRAVSPCSGRRVLVDLARESLSASSSVTTRPIGQLDGPVGLIVGDTVTVDRRLTVGGGVSTSTGIDLGGLVVNETVHASDNPGNAMALAIASAVAANGIGTALKTASLDLPRMTPRSNATHLSLAAVANNSAASTASLLSTASLQQIPAVLASKHWPEFHNGVAVGLSVSPHASVDATWIMYNCRSAITSANRPIGTATQPPTADLPSAEQAGMLLGLGLNGHLNKLTPYDIGEYLVRVHDLHNMAVLVGLCAGKRGSMDQSVLRLLAVHYRPLLPSDPLVHVQLSVPSLCQAAAVFGLGLLYEGSAHRHITNLLLNELGRSLCGPISHGVGRSTFQFDGDSSVTGTSASNTATASVTTNGWTGAAGSGGFAGDSCELIALSAGLALGLVLLRRADTPCGLSDLPWAEKLHAYMVGAPRCSEPNALVSSSTNMFSVLTNDCARQYLFSDPPSVRALLSRRLASRPTCRTVADVSSILVEEGDRIDRSTRSDVSRLSHATGLLNLHDLLISDDVLLIDSSVQNDLDNAFTPSESRTLGNTVRSGRTNLSGGVNSSGNERIDFTGRPSDRRARPDFKGFSAQGTNSKIRELNSYNTDVSGPGAIMALGMAYLGSGSATISAWLIPPCSLVQLEALRPDFLLFRALAHGLVNWFTIEPTMDWVVSSFCPSLLIERLSRVGRPKNTIPVSAAEQGGSHKDAMFSQLSSEDDVENRCPDTLPIGTRYPVRRSDSGSVTTTPSVSSAPNRVSRSATSRRREVQTTCRTVTRQLSPRTQKLESNLRRWQDQFATDTTTRIDEEALSLAYLNILVGRAFVLGLRYAGTCLPAAAQLLLDLAHSILNGSWWPPAKDPLSASHTYNQNVLPHPILEYAVAHCLLSLAMVLAGSGDVTLLRLVRQLRAIRLFSQTKLTDANRTADTEPSLSSFANRPRLYAVASMAARAAATTQLSSTASSTSSGPVSVAAVFGATLGPSFGIQLVYGSIIGLLFLGGGRLTLSNTPEAAAILSIAFLPILPSHSGDNWYHLQALRHLYVLATRPRRLCAVDVDTGRVTLSNMIAKFRDKPEFISSKDTIIFPMNSLDDLAWVEINHDSEDYWPTAFYNGTVNWELLKAALQQVGYIFVKKRDTTTEFELLDAWLTEEKSRRNILEPRALRQIKLVLTFLKRFPVDRKPRTWPYLQPFDAAQLISAAVTEQFVRQKNDLADHLRQYYLSSEESTVSSSVVNAFRIWFSLPPSSKLRIQLDEVGDSPSLIEFVRAVRPACPVTTPNFGLFWLYSFLFSSPIDRLQNTNVIFN